MLRFALAVLMVAGTVLVAGAVGEPSWQQEGETPRQVPTQEQDKIDVPSKGPEAVARRDFMRTKLRFSQMVFEGLTLGNLKQVTEAATEINEITQGAQWVTVDDERYQKLTEEFETTTRRLIEASQSGNIDATALRYYQMSTSCIDCHKHIRKVGYDY